MQGAIGGDRTQYRALLDALIPLVTAIARNCLLQNGRDVSELEDIVQESFLAIHLKRHMWDPSRPLVPWVRALVMNRAIDFLRRKGHRITVPIEAYENVIPARTNDFDLRADEVERLIETLKGRQRDVLEAIAIKGMSIKEAASSLGMSEGSARVTLHRGLKALAERYRKMQS